MRGFELRVGEHVVLSRFHARLSKSVHESEHSMYAFSVENSIHASLTERIVNATSQLCEETLRREEGNETHDSESIRNVAKENEWEKSRVNALNKSFLDCILEVKKRNCIEDANDDESSMIDDEFFDCASPEHADDMNIENFLVDGHRYLKIPNDIKCDNLCLEVKFISISNDFIFEIEKVLERYQIKIIKSLNENYIRSLFKYNEIELSLMAHKTQLGYNENEVYLIPKNPKKSGFFEKFFQLFS